MKNTVADDTYTTIIQHDHNGSVYRLITRVMKLPNKILEFTTKNSSWKYDIEQRLKSLTSNLSPIVVIKIDSESTLEVSREIENVKSIIDFR